jgi:hypothetical protein
MNYFLFWSKILVKRTIDLIKQSPVIFIGMIIIISAFIIGRQNITIALNIKTTVILLFTFAVLSIISSLKNYHVISALISYSKSNLQNKNIKIIFFVNRAFKNNLLLIIIGFILFTRFIKMDYYAIIPIIVIPIISLVLSFFIMLLKNGYLDKKIYKIACKKSKINPFIKSSFHDYFTLDFFVMAVFCFTMFVVIIIESSMDMSFIRKMDNPTIILTAITAILSLGFMGIISSIPNINWKFFSIIYPQNIFSHIKKTALFMAGVFGLLLVVFFFITVQIGVLALVKYLYSIIISFLFSIYNAFTRNNMIIKGIRAIFFIVLVIWVSALNPVFLFIPIIPLLIIALLAKDDFREWYLQ